MKNENFIEEYDYRDVPLLPTPQKADLSKRKLKKLKKLQK